MVDRRSFRSPFYAQLSSMVEGKLGLPRGLLHGIVTKGERSNADQVSSADARTVFQIIPSTRAAIKKKYGIDAYASPENAAMAAGHLLKESLQRNKGSISAAVAEYHGGTDRRGWGPKTRAYVGRVTGRAGAVQTARAAPPASSSTFDRVRGRLRQEEASTAGPSMVKVYQAYRSGTMSPAERREFESDVESGAIMLPRGAAIRTKMAAAPVLPAGVIDAYNKGALSQAERAELDEDLKSGAVALPRGAGLTGPKPRTFGQNLAIGARGVVEGAADLLGVVSNPLNALVNMTGIPQAVMGSPLRTNLGQSASEALTGVGVPEVRPEEELTNRVIRGGAGGLGMAGLARGGASLATGVTREVLRTVGAAPTTDLISGAASGAGGKIGGDVAGAPGELIGSMIGGLGGVGGANAAQRVSGAVAQTRLGRATAETVNDVAAQVTQRFPRAALVDDTGRLTDDGIEIATRTNIDPDQLVAAYGRGGGPGRPPQAANDRSVAGPSPAPDVSPPPVGRLPEMEEAAVAAPRDGSPASADGPVTIPIRASEPQIGEAALPPMARAPLPRAPSAGDNGGGDLNPNFAEAQSEGVQLTRGQAEQSFGVQNDEQSLRAAATKEGEQTREFLEQQQEQIKEAVSRFREGFGKQDATAADRGTIVKEAVRDLRDRGAAGVRELYAQAQAMGGDELKLNTTGIADAAKRALVEADVPTAVKSVIRQEMARYGLIGKVVGTAEDGLTTVQLADKRKIQFFGEPQELSVANADEFRKAISAQYLTDGPRKLSQQVKAAIDDSMEEAMERAAQGEVTGPVGDAYKAAREAHQAQKQAFSARDIIQRLIDFKKGTDTDVVLPERGILELLGTGKEGVTNLKKVKAVLLSTPTKESKQAWSAIQAQGIANIFDQAVNVQTGAISGARLNTALSKFGEPKLKVLLGEAEFGQLMKLRRIVGVATVPVPGTTNPSGTFYKLANFLTKGALRFTGGFGDAAMALAGKARDLAATQRTLGGVKSYDGRNATSQQLDSQARDFIRAFIDEGQSGRLMPSGIAAGGSTTSPGEETSS